MKDHEVRSSGNGESHRHLGGGGGASAFPALCAWLALLSVLALPRLSRLKFCLETLFKSFHCLKTNNNNNTEKSNLKMTRLERDITENSNSLFL